ncbi:T9SS type A sorting domain-containing protein [Aureibacter tunicatorum]|uniref:Nucleic acid-binding Zn-ribbon protein n=1 Tax=Aureibacter tunicatorum TaxID=866807 RepID=A0AAE3XKW7_9BACT|nr:T9SS type A sorting domain-containing protein [Aureibacter tunicatorum]MDR6238312.1 putative nucleic acid-binding Zn-ribbon protein [Aureibacter tunicatorum]BDD03344.1 hypothetical protein AUTU_08270 [Aureibacter tunicatorum]
MKQIKILLLPVMILLFHKLYYKDTPTNYNIIQNENSICIFPNPASNIIKLKNHTENEFYTITIFNPIGNEIKKSKISNRENMNIQNLKKGKYIVSIKNDENKVLKVQKLIKL